MDPEVPDRFHDLLMDLVHVATLLQPDRLVPGQQISVSQAFTLHELDTDTPLSQRDLTERLHLEKSTVSRMVAEMQRKGLVERERDPVNRRVYRLWPTEEGRVLHARIRAAFHDQHMRWVEIMTTKERDALLTGLPALIRAMNSELAPTRTVDRAG